MGMSTHVVGFVPPDEKWQKMLAVYNACTQAGIDLPNEVECFFGGEDPNNQPGKDINLEKFCIEFNQDYRQGYTLDLDKVPENVKFIRFYNSW